MDMARPRKPLNERHEDVLKIRLTERQRKYLEERAAALDIPVAILGRSMMMAALAEQLRKPEAA
jgi:hypothetical protein